MVYIKSKTDKSLLVLRTLIARKLQCFNETVIFAARWFLFTFIQFG